MADEYDAFDDGFDNDLDKMLDSVETEPSLAKKPTNKREVVVNTLEDASKGFIDEYKDAPINAVGDILKKSIPSEISEEVGGILNVKDSLKDEYKNVVKDVKKNAKSTYNIVKKILPKNKITNKIINKLDNVLGGDEEEVKKGPSKEELEQQAIQANIANAIGAQDKLDSTESLFKQTLEYNRFKTTEELNNISASRLTEISNFNRNITYKYFAKSLELQYKSIYISKEQLDVIKTIGDTFKNQFESIVKNTSLPDIIKVRSSEAIKHQLKAKAANDLTDTLFKEKGVFSNVTDKIKTIGGNVKTKINNALNTTSDLAEQKAMMDEMSMPGISKGTMAGSLLANYANTLIGQKLSRKIANNDTAKKGMYTLKNVLADPSAYINKAASKVGYNGFLRSKAALGLNTVSDILNTNEKMTNISVGKDDLDNAKLFDGRAYSSITKVIPGLLSKIYSELKSTRLKDNKPSNHELTYDFEKGTFNRKKDTVKELKHKISTRIENTAAVGLDTLISYMQEYGGLKITNKKELDSIRKALTAYVISGKPLVPELMVDYGFLDYFKGKSKKKMSTVMDNLRIGLKNNIYANEYFIKGLKQYKNSLPKIEKDVESIAEAGNIKLLKDAGIMTYDEVYGTYNTSEETLSKLYLDSVGGLDTNGFKFDKSKVKKQKEKKTTSTGIKSKLNNVKKDISNKAEVVKKKANDTLNQVKNSDTVKQATDTIDKVKKSDTVKQAKKILTDTNIKDVIDEVKEEANKKASKTTNQVKKQATDTIDKVNKNETVVEAKKQASNTLDKVKKSDTVKQAKKILSDTNVKDIVDEVKEEVKKDLEDTTLDTIKEKVATNIDKAKELAKNSTETVKSKIEKTYEEINTPELTEEQEEALKEDFLNSKAFKEGKVTSFRTYLKSLGFGNFDSKKFLNNVVVKSKEYALKAKQFLTDRLNPFLKTITTEEEEALKKEYENSEAIKNGVTFSQYMKAFGFKPKLNLKANIRALLKKTRALDRKIATAVVKSPVTLAKKLFSKKDDTKKGSGLAGRVVKGTLKGAGTAIGLGAESFTKGITGYDLWGPNKDAKDKNILDKTRGLDRTAAKAILMTPKTISNLIKTTTTSIIDKINKSKKKKVNKFDTDGDGKREGNWKDRLKGLMGSKKDKKDPRKRGILNFVKNNKGLSTTAILTGVLLAMKSMGITMDDVMGVAKGIWSGIKDIGHFLSPIFGFLKKTFTKIGDVMSGIASFFGIKTGDDKSKNSDSSSSSTESIGKGVAYGVGGLAAYKVGKTVYKGGKAIYKGGKAIYKGDEAALKTDKTIYKTGKAAYEGEKSVYKTSKAAYKATKTVSNTAKTTENVASKVAKATKSVPKSKTFLKKIAKKVLVYLSKFKKLILKRFGPKLAGKFLSKIASRFVPVLGWALVLYDAGMIAYDVFHNGTDFKVAVSNQILGFNIFGDDVPTDENGKPLEDKGLEKKALAKVKPINVPSIDKESNSAGTIGKGIAYGAAGLTAYKGGKAVYKSGKAAYKATKTVSSAVKTTENVASKVAKATKSAPKSKSFLKRLAKKVLRYLSKFKKLIVKKFGPKLASKFLAKISSRFVPFLGWALVLYDAGMIAYDMYHNGTKLKVAISKQILGFNIFGDDVPTDENGKPLEDKGLEQKALAKVKHIETSNISGMEYKYKFNGSINNNSNNNSTNNNIKKHTAANNVYYKKNVAINSKTKTIGYGEDKVNNNPPNTKTYKPSKDVNVRGGKLYNPDGGENNITLAKGVTIDGLNPAMDKKLKAMANEYNAITGKKIHINSGYRSTAYQAKLRRKYGSRAARPGHSTHEFGLAVDINGSTLDELDNLGLMGKYKLTRPVGKEKWHVEPAGVQLDINNAKKDPDYAANLIDNVSKGGGGWGLVGDARKYSRNKKYQEELIESKSFKVIDPNTGKSSIKLDTPKPIKSNNKLNVGKAIASKGSTVNPVSKDTGVTTKSSPNTKLAQAKDHITNKKMDSFVKPMKDNVDVVKESNSHLSKISSGIGDSVELQRRMLNKLDEISKVITNKPDEEEKNTPANNIKHTAPSREHSSLPKPAVSLARASF